MISEQFTNITEGQKVGNKMAAVGAASNLIGAIDQGTSSCRFLVSLVCVEVFVNFSCQVSKVVSTASLECHFTLQLNVSMTFTFPHLHASCANIHTHFHCQFSEVSLSVAIIAVC